MRAVLLRTLFGVLCACLGLWSAPAVWAFGFSVDPARVQVTVPSGKRRGQTLTVSNQKDTSVHLTVYVRDAIFLPDGTHEFPPPGSTDWSCAEWVQVIPKEFDVPAKSSQDVRVSVSVPEGATGGHYAMIFFESGPSYQEQGIGVNFRVGALVEAIVPGTEQYASSLKAFAFVPPNSFQTAIFNSGNALVRPAGFIKIFNVTGKVQQALLNPNNVGILPNTLRSFMTELDSPLPPGNYQAKIEVDYGARTLLVGERAFRVE